MLFSFPFSFIICVFKIVRMIFLTTRILYHDVSENSLVINCFYWFYDKMFSVMHHMLSSNIFMVHVGGFMVNKKNENLDSQRRIAEV